MRIQWCRCKVVLHTPWNGQLLDVKFESRQMPKAITTNMVPLSTQNVKLIFLGNHLRLPTCIVLRQDATWRFTKYILFLILQTALILLEFIQDKNVTYFFIYAGRCKASNETNVLDNWNIHFKSKMSVIINCIKIIA